MLDKLTANFGPDYELVDVSYVNVALYYAPEERNRVALRWEHRRMCSALGPCPPLFVLQHPRLCIRDVLLPFAEVSPHVWVKGRVVLCAQTARPPCGAHVIADLHIDAATPIRVGSRVHYGGLGGNDFTVKALSADGSAAKLFYDVRGEEFYLDDEPVGKLHHLPQNIPLLSVDSAAAAFTRFGVLTGACQFGHGVGGFTTNFIHSNGRPGFTHTGAGERLPQARRGRVLWRFLSLTGGAARHLAPGREDDHKKVQITIIGNAPRGPRTPTRSRRWNGSLNTTHQTP